MPLSRSSIAIMISLRWSASSISLFKTVASIAALGDTTGTKRAGVAASAQVRRRQPDDWTLVCLPVVRDLCSAHWMQHLNRVNECMTSMGYHMMKYDMICTQSYSYDLSRSTTREKIKDGYKLHDVIPDG